MGTYLNPGNVGFSRILNGEYIDKSGLISLINASIDKTNNLTCISRPRRFGKSFAAQMLCAYYDKTCDSEWLFNRLAISETEDFRKHLNKYDVIYLNMTDILAETVAAETVNFIKRKLIGELKEAYPQLREEESFAGTLLSAVEEAGNKFIMVIDEWDAPIRETPEMQQEYLHFLRLLFKSSNTTPRIFAAAYMTGILPIKKDGSQSALSDFREYTMIRPGVFGDYVGFTEREVRELCKKHDVEYERMKLWYDGYEFRNTGAIYNPNSVMEAIRNREFDSYWIETTIAGNLMAYISRDYSGLSKTVAELIAGVDVKVDTIGFANDLTTFRGKDDILTLLIHLGYLAYDSETKTARIPNEEIRREFARAVRETDHAETQKRLEESDRLFYDTIHGNEEAVAAQIEKIHAEETAPLHYNREDSLRSVIKLAYYTYKDNYLQWEELPAGKGYADIVYLPKRDSGYPALVIELKWNDSAEGAIQQILDRNYPEALKGYGGEIILAGINYNKNAPVGERKHTCRIFRIEETD